MGWLWVLDGQQIRFCCLGETDKNRDFSGKKFRNIVNKNIRTKRVWDPLLPELQASIGLVWNWKNPY